MLEKLAAKLDRLGWKYHFYTDSNLTFSARLVVPSFAIVDSVNDELEVSFNQEADFKGAIFFLQLLSKLDFKFKVAGCHRFDEEEKELRPADWDAIEKEIGDLERMIGGVS